MNVTAAHQAILDDPEHLVFSEGSDRYELDGRPVADALVFDLFAAQLLARVPWTRSYRAEVRQIAQHPAGSCELPTGPTNPAPSRIKTEERFN